MRIVKYISVLVLIVVNLSCTDVIDLDTGDTTRALNVYGHISDTTGTQVSLSLTTSYFDQNTNPPINDADVFLFEDGVSVGQLNPLGAEGKYELDYSGTLGKSYHIEILLPTHYGLPQNWSSQPEVLSRVFKADSFNTRFLTKNSVPSVFEEGYYSLLYFQEPKGVGDSYRIRRWLNDSLFAQDFLIFDDANFDGADFGGSFPGVAIYGPMEIGDTNRIEISSISRPYYDYLSLIVEQVFQIGGPFDPPPSPIVGNIYNSDDPKDYGFGFFFASAQNYAETVVVP